MRKILIGGVVVLVIFLVVFRQRVFLRDPLGRVERNGVRQGGMRVYINYSNDVLVEDVAAHRFVLVQGWSFLPGVPLRLACVSGMACWTEANEAPVTPLGTVSAQPSVQSRAVMNAKEVSFVDGSGESVRVVLR